MLDEIVTVVKKCGDIILFADGAERNVSSKEGRANFVTKYDVAVQAYLEEELLKILPEAVFIGEEGEHSKAIGEGYFRLTSFGSYENTLEAVERIKKLK